MWHYPLKGELHYFSRGEDRPYSMSGLLRAMALYIESNEVTHSPEGGWFFPESGGWSGVLLMQEDKVPS